MMLLLLSNIIHLEGIHIVYLEVGGSTFLQIVCHHLLADTIL